MPAHLTEMESRPLIKSDSCGPVPVVRIGNACATLINGVCGDPLLRLELLHKRRSLLFDLGDPGRMSARVAHQVTDLFISHTHADHIGGFLWFLRARIGHFPPCRVYGPAGLAWQLAGMVDGILWDRIEDRGPVFEVREWHGDSVRCYRVAAGEGPAKLVETLPLEDGVLWRDSGFLVRAVQLDHDTPVLAYAWESAMQLKVRRERLEALGLKHGRWLQALKEAVLNGRTDDVIATPDGSEHTVQHLADNLLLVAPGQTLVYAPAFSATPANRQRLVELAKGAHTLFCEATFMLEDVEQAERTCHLTTQACAEIAEAAGVTHLQPFHFSRRYTKRLPDVYREIAGFTTRLSPPEFMDELAE